MPREKIEEPGISPKEKVHRIVEWLAPLENTIQSSWLIEMAQIFFGFSDERITSANWEALYDRCAGQMAQPNWDETVLRRSKLDAVFLTNEFDDPLEGFDTSRYIPCLRTDDLVFKLADSTVRERLQRATGITVTSARTARQALGSLFEHFVSHGAKACAISLPPDFSPEPVSSPDADSALSQLLRQTSGIDIQRRVSHWMFWMLAELCAEHRLPFDLMIGVNRSVYLAGVHQGRDLYDSRVSLIQYAQLFNRFPQVTFPISVLASVTNQELVSYSWIFPNVVTNGHWWYSNTPTYIEHDVGARLEAVPATKQIGYYSDMYKLEFALPKFAMYKRVLAKILAERFVIQRRWSEDRALQLGRRVLRGNIERIFGIGDRSTTP
jgi:glucuronate isomerase